ncbi:MAG TPA: protein kinase [Kofleriaceae bacterium]|nr:protein kinase [Kofleriaceae bacterium]
MSTAAASIRVADFELFERLGEGGSGQVHRAVDREGTQVAVKLLGPAADLDPEAAHARFRREVAILAQLDHPALVSLVAHGVDDELGPYLVMPLVPGTSLRQAAAGAKLCPEAAVLLVEPVASAVAALHERSLVHRDLKPENVMVTPDGKVVVVDLGLAWGPDLSRHTAEGVAIGSIPYMAPEQLEGSGVGTAADVWAVGVMLYELIAGKRPFARARASEEAAAVLVGAYAPLDAIDPRCPPELVRLVTACLDRAPGARPSAHQLATELAALVDWADRADWSRERAAIAHAPAAYVARVAPFRVRREKRLAREAIAAGRPFQALAHVDRALAYAPDDAELVALASEYDRRVASGAPSEPIAASEPAAAPPAAAIEPKRRRSKRWLAIPAALVAIGGTIGIVVATRDDSTARPTAAPTTTATLAPAADPWAAPVREPAPPPKADPPPPPPTTTVMPDRGDAPIPGLPPLSPAGIPNDGPDRTGEMKAPSGENLVPEERLEKGSPAAAIADIDGEVAKNPDRLNRLGQAMVYVAAGRKDDGLAKLEKLLADYPDYGRAWAAKGYLMVRAGRAHDADVAMTKAIELDPDDAEALRNRGILRDHMGRSRDAYADLVAALRRDPTDVEAMSELAQVYSVAGHRDDARPLLERIVKLRPDNVTGWLDLSLVQPMPEAVKSIQHALALEPRSQRGRVRLCTVLAEGGDKAAIAACGDAVKAAPSDPWAWMGRGLARYQLANDKGGLDDIDHAIAMAPKNAQFYINRYIMRSHAGMQQEAVADLKQACTLGKKEACDKAAKL